MKRTDLQALAEERLEDARAMLASGRYGAAYYIVGYAVECGLKACIARLTQAEDFYDKKLASKIFVHDIQALANTARIRDAIDQMAQADPQFAANWA
jgi:HEPN domain-containing protein